MDDKVTFTSLEEAIGHINGIQQKAVKEVDLYNQNFKEFVGYHPQQQVTAYDVVSIVARMLTGHKGD